jgi:trk system potassium uptake protein
VPEHGLVHLLELRKEDLEIVEVQVDEDSPCVGKRVSDLKVPEGATVIAVMRGGKAEGPEYANELAAGDQVLAVLRSGKEEDLRKLLLKPAR